MNPIEADKRARAIAALNPTQHKCQCWHWIVAAFVAGALFVLTMVS
jgi:hypothetical protein